jgi:hypothetical protein
LNAISDPTGENIAKEPETVLNKGSDVDKDDPIPEEAAGLKIEGVITAGNLASSGTPMIQEKTTFGGRTASLTVQENTLQTSARWEQADSVTLARSKISLMIVFFQLVLFVQILHHFLSILVFSLLNQI